MLKQTYTHTNADIKQQTTYQIIMKKHLLVALALTLLIAAKANAAFVLDENFNTLATGVPSGWSNTGGTCSSTYRWQSDATGFDGHGVSFNSSYASSGSTGWLQTPALTLAGDYVLKFRYRNYSAGQLDVYLSADGGTTLGTRLASNLTTSSSSEWGYVEIPLNIKKRATTYKIVFVATANYGSYKQYLDEVQIETYPTCKSPESLYLTNLTPNTAGINWALSAIGYDDPVYLQMTVRDENGTTIYQNDTIPGSTFSHTLTGLQPATTYTVQMRSDCDTEDPTTGLSSYSGFSDYATFSFATACNAIEMPYNENFDAINSLDVCSNIYNAAITTTAAQSGRKSLVLSATENDIAYVIFPLLNVASNDMEISFNARSSSNSIAAQYMAGIVTDLGDIFSSFEPVLIDSVKSTTWVNIRTNTSQAYTASNQSYVMILLSSGNDISLFIDDISIHSIPTCIRPEQLTISNVTDMSATLNWTTSNAPQHIIYITDATGNTSTQLTTQQPPYTVTGLQPNSQYSFQVRGYCNATDSSEISPTTVICKTLCQPLATAFWSEGAESSTGQEIPDCWRKGFYKAPTSTYSTYEGFITTTSEHHSGSRCFQLQDMTAGTRSYLISNGFYVDQANEYDLSIWVYRTSGSSYNGEGLALWISNNSIDTTGAQYLGFINRMAGNSPAETSGTGWYQYRFPISKTGTVYLIVEGRSQYGSSTYFDDIEVLTAPTCHKVSDITIGNATTASNTISWTPSANNEQQWVAAYTLKQGNNIILSDSTTLNQPSLTLNNLSPATSYSVSMTVYALCSPTDMSEGLSINGNFSTPCGTVTVFPYREDFEGQTTSSLPTCWDNSASTATSTTAHYIWGVAENGGNKFIRMYNYLVHDGDAVINMPAMVFPSRPMRMTFDYSNRADCGNMEVRISTDGGANFTTIGTYSQGSAGTSSTTPGTFTTETIDLSAYAGQSVTIRFHAMANYGNGAIFVDNIVIRSITNCQDLGCSIGMVDGTSAIINTDAATPCNWQLSIGTTPEDSVISVSNATNYTLTGLQPSTSYTVYVRRDCGTEQGDWSAAQTFRTTKLCGDVTATIGQITENSAVVTGAGASGNWQISIGTTPGDSIIDVTSPTYLLTGLTPMTQYTLFVRNNCDTMFGDWSHAYTFSTPAVPDYPPYQTGFEDDTENAKWTIVNGTSTSTIWTFGSEPAAVASGSKALYIASNGQYTYNSTVANKTFAYRTLGFRSENYTISFKWKCTGGESTFDFGRVMLVPASEELTGGSGVSYSSTTWPDYIEAFDPDDDNKMNLTEGDADGWNIYSTTLDMTNRAGIYNFVVMWSNDGSVQTGPEPLAIDNLSITNLTCLEPATATSNTTATGTTINVNSMDASAWQVVVSSTPIDPFGTVTGDIKDTVITTTSLNVTDLSANTTYYYTARGICSPTDSSNWTNPKDFRTNCAAYEIPYSEGFEDVNSVNCWITPGTGIFGRATNAHHSGSASCMVSNITAISPELNADSLSKYMINGFAYTTEDSSSFSIGVAVDPDDVSAMEILGTVMIPNSGEWTEFTTYFTALADDPDLSDFSDAKHIAIVVSSDVVIYLDDIIIGPTPTCPKVTSPSITNILANSADIDWSDNAGASRWIVTTVPVNGGTTITDTVSSHPYTVSGLNGSTSYNVSVKAICGAADISYPTDCGTFRTACSIVNAPWTEDFESNSTGYAPSCWDNSESTTTPISAAWTICNVDGNKMARVNDYYGSSNGLSILTSPIISLDANKNYVFSFDYDCASTSITLPSVSISTNGGSTWTTLGSLPTNTSTTDRSSNPMPGTLTRYDYDISNYAGNNVKFKFQCTTHYGYGALVIDNISLREGTVCMKPQNVSASNITGNSVTLSWTAGNENQWVVKSTANNASRYDTVYTNPCTITGLSSSTTYQVSVQALCVDGGTSAFSNTASFKTACGTILLPWSEDFQSYSNLSVLDCWSTSGSTSYAYQNYYMWGIYQETSGNKSMRMNNSQVQTGTCLITSPQIQLPANNSSELKFKYCHQSNGGALMVKVHQAGSSNWTTIGTYTQTPGATSSTTPASFTEVSYELASFKGQTIELRFEATSNYSSGAIFVDDISITELSSCRNILSISATATDSSAIVTFNDTSTTHNQWQYAYGPSGFDIHNAELLTATNDTISINGLSASSGYDVYVRAYCDEDNQSNWIMTSFRTTTLPAEMPYVCNFDDPLQNSGWEMLYDGPNSFVIGGDINALLTGTSALYVSNNASTYTYSTTTASRAAAYRLFHFNESEYVIEFDWKCNGGEANWDYGRFYLVPASSGVVLPQSGSFSTTKYPANLIALDGNTAKAKTTQTWNFTSETVNFEGRSDDYYLVFTWVNDNTGGTSSYPLSIDNIYIREILCPDLPSAPVISNTTMSTMTVSAPMLSKHAGIKFAYGPAATTTTIADTIGSVFSATGQAIIPGLRPSTSYKVFASGICQSGDTTIWTSAATGTTMASDCFEPQNLHLVGTAGEYTATLCWGGAPDAQGYEYQITGTSIQGTVQSDTLNLTGLNPATTYTLQVRTLCADGPTAWASVTFETTLAPAPLPYICDWENASENNQWTVINGSGGMQFTIGSATSNGGTNSLYITDDGISYSYSSTSSSTASVVYAQRFFNLTAGQYVYSFDWQCNGETNYDYGRALLMPENMTLSAGTKPSGLSTTATPANCIALDNNSQINKGNGWQTQQGTINIPADGLYNLTFMWENDGSVFSQPPLAIDNIQLLRNTCPMPTVSTVNAGTNTASATVTSNADTIIYAVSTGNLGDITRFDTLTTSKTINLTGLSASTQYYLYVKVHCGQDDESMWVTKQFRTSCGIVDQFPYTESFESVSTTFTSANMIEDICWSQIGATSSSSSSYPKYLATSSYAASEGSKTLQLQAGTGQSLILVMPEFITTGNMHVSFDYKTESMTSSSGVLYYGYLTNPSSANSFVSMGVAPRCTTSYVTYTVDYGTLPAGSRLAFKYADATSGAYFAWLDNVVVTQLVQGSTFNGQVCYDEPYTDYGFNVPANKLQVGNNTKTRIKAGLNGAPDTLHTANIYKFSEIKTEITDSACAGTAYSKGVFMIPNPRTRQYFRTYRSSTTGCDSTVTLNLYVHDTHETLFDTICQGASYPFDGQALTKSGTYTRYSTTAMGCTDTITLHLNVVPTHSTTNETICNGSVYSWHGQTYTTAGTYYWNGTGSHGCPLSDTLNLSVINGDSTLSITLCPGSQYFFRDTIITSAGTYKRSYYDPYITCQITITLTVTMTAMKESHINDSLCEGQKYTGYGLRDLEITNDTAIDIQTRTSDMMCDSVIHIHIHVIPIIHTYESAFLEGESYTWNNQSYTSTGDYTITLQSVVTGCDSIVTLQLRGVGLDYAEALNMTVIPNPVNSGQTSYVYGNFDDVLVVDILNQFGQVIDSFEPTDYPIEISGITASGFYYVRVTTSDGHIAVRKLIVQ